MLIQSGLPPSFWAEAIATANRIRNRCITKSLDEGTPHEKWTGKRPNVGYFRTFGCKVLILNKIPNKDKFEPKTLQGIFVGYSDTSKAYRVWIPSERKIRVSRDVRFFDEFENDGRYKDDRTAYPFRELIGALMYVAIGTRPDITHAVNSLSQFNGCHRKVHWIAAKRILRYLKGTIDLKLVYRKDNENLRGYVDADWGNCIVDRRFYTGSTFILSGAAISWESRKQRTVALSSIEAEYMSITDAAKEAIHLTKFLNELGFSQLANAELFNDNQGAGKLAENPIFHSRSKHIDIRHHFIRDVLATQPLKLSYLPTEKMIADVLTKPLMASKHIFCFRELGLVPVKSPPGSN